MGGRGLTWVVTCTLTRLAGTTGLQCIKNCIISSEVWGIGVWRWDRGGGRGKINTCRPISSWGVGAAMGSPTILITAGKFAVNSSCCRHLQLPSSVHLGQLQGLLCAKATFVQPKVEAGMQLTSGFGSCGVVNMI